MDTFSAHSGRTSDCGGTVVGIVYVCAALVFHSRCKRGLPRRIRLSVHGVKGLIGAAAPTCGIYDEDPVAGETEEGDK